MKNKLLFMILSLLGFATACSSCSDEEEFMCEYGTPFATFSVKGKVLNKSGEPIPNIKVSVNHSSHSFVASKEDGSFILDKHQAFYLKSNSSGSDFNIIFTDIDGAENGQYKEHKAVVTFTENPDFKSDSSWHQGDFYTNEEVIATMEEE